MTKMKRSRKNLLRGKGLGKGHSLSRKMPPIREVSKESWPPALKSMVESGAMELTTRVFKMGACTIFTGQSGSAGWHLSIAHPKRMPNYRELVHARYQLIPDRVLMAEMWPSKLEYVDLHSNCRHLWELDPKQVSMTALRQINRLRPEDAPKGAKEIENEDESEDQEPPQKGPALISEKAQSS